LIELLVVITTTAILAPVRLPALSRAKSSAQATTCGSNVKQLAVAWLLYTHDNDDALLNNSSTVDTRTYRQSSVNNIQNWTSSVENTNAAFVLSGRLDLMADGPQSAVGGRID